MKTPFINIYLQLGENYRFFYKWIKGKLEFEGNKISPKYGLCDTWIRKWNRKCEQEGKINMKIDISKKFNKILQDDPMGFYHNGNLDFINKKNIL